MTLDEIKSHHAALIDATPALAAFGGALVYSDFADDETQQKAIADRLRDYGVAIEVGAVSEAAGDRGEQAPNRPVKVDAEFEVYVAESPKVAHSPMDLELVRTVCAAVRTRPASNEQNARLAGYMKARHEHGYVLHILTFSIPALV